LESLVGVYLRTQHVKYTLHRRHVSAYTVAIFRPYVFEGIHLLNFEITQRYGQYKCKVIYWVWEQRANFRSDVKSGDGCIRNSLSRLWKSLHMVSLKTLWRLLL
jgi:hypothetical protein